MMRPSTLDDLLVGDVISLDPSHSALSATIVGPWHGPVKSLEYYVHFLTGAVVVAYAIVDVSFRGQYTMETRIDESTDLWSFVSRPGVWFDDDTTSVVLFPDLTPAVVYTERLPDYVVSYDEAPKAAQRAESWVRRNMREWPHGKKLAWHVSSDKVFSAWFEDVG